MVFRIVFGFRRNYLPFIFAFRSCNNRAPEEDDTTSGVDFTERNTKKKTTTHENVFALFGRRITRNMRKHLTPESSRLRGELDK